MIRSTSTPCVFRSAKGFRFYSSSSSTYSLTADDKWNKSVASHSRETTQFTNCIFIFIPPSVLLHARILGFNAETWVIRRKWHTAAHTSAERTGQIKADNARESEKKALQNPISISIRNLLCDRTDKMFTKELMTHISTYLNTIQKSMWQINDDSGKHANFSIYLLFIEVRSFAGRCSYVFVVDF